MARHMARHIQFKKFLIDLTDHKIPKKLITIIEADPTYFTDDSQLHLIAQYFRSNDLDVYIKYIPQLLFYISDHYNQSFYQIKSLNTIDDEDKHDFVECPICLDEIYNGENNQIVQLTCTHIYHYKCISDWKSVRDCCPLCNRLIIYKIRIGNKIKDNINKLLILAVHVEEIIDNINKYCFFNYHDINHYYLLYQLILQEGINATEIEKGCLFDNIMMLTRENLTKNNDIWRKVCNKCNWGYSSIL